MGNDVVDLTDPRCVGKASHDRFLARVLSAAERRDVLGAADPDLALWTRWAAKEAAFKAVSASLDEPPVFDHAAFQVSVESSARPAREGGAPESGTTGDAANATRGAVRWRDVELPWRVAGGRDEEALHAVSWLAGPDEGAPVVAGGTEWMADGAGVPGERFTERERRAVHSPSSAWVRIRAREELARLTGRPERAFEIVCAAGPVGRTPPEVLEDGEPSAWGVSLSHHGRLLAWVVARPPTGEERAERRIEVVPPAVPPPRPRSG